MTDQIIVENNNGLATVTLNRPNQMNALTVEMLQELPGVIRTLSNDGSVRYGWTLPETVALWALVKLPLFIVTVTREVHSSVPLSWTQTK